MMIDYFGYFLLLIFFFTVMSNPIPFYQKFINLALAFMLIYTRYNMKKEYDKKLKEEQIDPITKIPNRKGFLDIIDKTIKSKEEFAFVYIDINDFKSINDSYGEEFGDYVLTEIAFRLKNRLTENDSIGRMDSDEFAIILSKKNPENSKEFIIDFLESIDINLEIYKKIYLACGVSYYPYDDKKCEKLLLKSHMATYESKKITKEKNVVNFYNEPMSKNYLVPDILKEELKSAILGEELFLVYQPVMNLKSNELISLESLIRWKKDEEIIYPDKFIPFSEESDLILKIDQMVLNLVCRQIRMWLNEGYDVKPVSVNVSAKTFSEETLVKDVLKNLEMYAINPKYIALEITESAFLKNKIGAIEQMKKLKEIGLKIYLDDFGKGYSQITSLKNYPVDVLKIDRDFIKNIGENHIDEVVINYTIQLGKTLDKIIVAEGVETEEQLNYLIKNNCDRVQGYYYSKPLTTEDFEKKYYKT
ncbi:bifunctional diguanylate cyclase/phosphodiesterase [Peptostreptococcaceae bacterium AGR-M142]